MQLDDITLMAYADGELDPVEASKVRSAIDNDADAAARLKVYIDSRNILTKEFRKIKNEEIPEHLLQTVLQHKASGSKKNVIQLIWNKPPQALAASLILGAIIGAGIFGTLTKQPGMTLDFRHDKTYTDIRLKKEMLQMQNSPNFDYMQLSPGTAILMNILNKALHKEPNADSYKLEIGDNVIIANITSSFIDSKGGQCKVIVLDYRDVQYIIACLDNDGEWEISIERHLTIGD